MTDSRKCIPMVFNLENIFKTQFEPWGIKVDRLMRQSRFLDNQWQPVTDGSYRLYAHNQHASEQEKRMRKSNIGLYIMDHLRGKV